MQVLLIDWKFLLETNGGVLGLALIVSGLALLLGGWRLERFTLFVIYAMAGAVGEQLFVGDVIDPVADIAIGGCVAVVVGIGLRKHAAPALAGALAALGVWEMLDGSFVPVSVIYIMQFLVFAAVAAPAASHLQGTTVVLSSFAGAALFASGLVAMVANSYVLAPHFRSMSSYGIFYPFLLLVPTVTGTFLQLSAAKRKDCGEVNL